MVKQLRWWGQSGGPPTAPCLIIMYLLLNNLAKCGYSHHSMDGLPHLQPPCEDREESKPIWAIPNLFLTSPTLPCLDWWTTIISFKFSLKRLSKSQEIRLPLDCMVLLCNRTSNQSVTYKLDMGIKTIEKIKKSSSHVPQNDVPIEDEPQIQQRVVPWDFDVA